jgi:hypothetical protein
MENKSFITDSIERNKKRENIKQIMERWDTTK